MNRVSADFNAPNKDEVFEFMDKAILKSGVNLIDTVSTTESYFDLGCSRYAFMLISCLCICQK